MEGAGVSFLGLRPSAMKMENDKTRRVLWCNFGEDVRALSAFLSYSLALLLYVVNVYLSKYMYVCMYVCNIKLLQNVCSYGSNLRAIKKD